jgi:hypothetical protein
LFPEHEIKSRSTPASSRLVRLRAGDAKRGTQLNRGGLCGWLISSANAAGAPVPNRRGSTRTRR